MAKKINPKNAVFTIGGKEIKPMTKVEWHIDGIPLPANVLIRNVVTIPDGIYVLGLPKQEENKTDAEIIPDQEEKSDH